MKDGRLISGSCDKSMIIYNKTNYQPDIIIKEHNDYISSICILSSGILVSADKTIKFFNIKGNDYKILQTLNFHSENVTEIIELRNKYLVSCSDDSSIIFYFKDNSEYKKDYQIKTNSSCYSIIQTKENEICYIDKSVCFFDLSERKIKTSISNISIYDSCRLKLIMINEELLLIPGYSKISIINVNHYGLVRVIDVKGSGSIAAVCLLNKNFLITGDNSKTIRQWRIEGDNLIPTYKKENSHDEIINVIIILGNGHFASCSNDHFIKIW